MKVVVAEPVDREALQLLRKFNPIFPEKDLKDHISDADVLIIRTYTIADKNLLSKAKKIKYLIRCGVGLENVDTDYCKERGIKVINAPASNSDAVAEHTILLILASLKNLVGLDASVRRGEWNRDPVTGLADKTVGILGFGHIGKEVARRLQGFDAKLLAYDVVQDKETAEKLGVKFVTLENLLRESDVVTVHVPLLKQTRHLLDSRRISMIKKGTIVVNTSRGAVIDEKALANALKSGHIVFAGIDVFESEPPTKSLLLPLKNTILTPHIAGLTKESFRRMCVQPIKEFLEDMK